jgi:hypothetical protein
MVIYKPAGTVTLFAFDDGEELSEHTAPYDAIASIIDGEATITIGGKEFHLSGRLFLAQNARLCLEKDILILNNDRKEAVRIQDPHYVVLIHKIYGPIARFPIIRMKGEGREWLIM